MKTLSAVFLLLSLSLGCARPDYISNEELALINKPTTPGHTCTLEFPATKICAHIQWAEAPSSSAKQEFLLTLDGDVTAFENLAILLWMPSMGHGSAPVKIERLSEREFRVYNVYFIMPGDWEVRMVLKRSQQNIDQLYIPLMIP